MEFLLPPALRAGDTIAVVAPSGPFVRETFLTGLAWLAGRYKIRMRSSAYDRRGYLAGSDERRAAELNWALAEPQVKAVVAARGGYGATRILEQIQWDRLARSPRWLVGFSDITALHLRVLSMGIASIHGPNVTGLGKTNPRTRSYWLQALERPSAVCTYSSLRTLRAGNATGPLIGGNLTVLAALAAAGCLPRFERAVWLLEDVGERPYRLDRTLTSLRPHLSRASAVIFGEFTDCVAGTDGTTAHDVLAAFARDGQIPVVTGMPSGHGELNDALVLGRTIALSADASGEASACMDSSFV